MFIHVRNSGNIEMENINENEEDFIKYIITSGNEGHYLGDIITPRDYSPQEIERLTPWFLIEAILYGGLGQISSRCFEFDSMITQMFRERTKFFLDLIPNEGLNTSKKILCNLIESSKHLMRIPLILKRYCKSGIISFSNQIIDLKITAKEVDELIKEYHWLSRKICNL